MTLHEARQLLEEAHTINPGPWKDHCVTASRVARSIAGSIQGLDPDFLEMAALLHDIGRIRKNPGIRHSIDGFNYLMDLGEPGLARFCMSHSFPGKYRFDHHGPQLSPRDLEFLETFLADTDFDLADQVIQVADSMASPFGPMVMEVRLVESLRRNRVQGGIMDFITICLDNKAAIDRAAGFDVYILFPDLRTGWPAIQAN